jgi:NADP-dependent 3-hydroxy acid dehydrogenase YdfG
VNERQHQNQNQNQNPNQNQDRNRDVNRYRDRDHDENLSGKVVAITGASSGIGAATAEHLGARGALVVVGARRIDRLAGVVARIEQAGGSAVAVEVDVRHRADLERLVGVATERFGRLDVLVSNAGSMAISRFDELRADDWDDMVDVNVKGVLNGIAAALPVFRAQGSGHFVNTASTSAYRIVPAQGVYAATKTAVTVLSEALRQEAGPDLRVTIVSPGFTDTEGVGKGVEGEVAAALEERRRTASMPPSAIAEAIAYAIAQPAGVDVGEIVVRPTAQD